MASSRTKTIIATTALTLGATALLNHALARQAERDHPPAGRFVQAGGIDLHVLESGQGDGPPVVLLHGNGVTAADWVASGVFGLASARRRVLAFDRPGYGYSERPRDRFWTAAAQAAVLAEAFLRLGVERPVVVGHSWGTLVAMALALDHPDSVSGLVLLSGYYFPTARADIALFSPPAIPVLGDVIRYTAGPLVGGLIAPKMIEKMFAPAPVPPGFTEAVPIPIMLRPGQIKASAEDAASMSPWAASAQGRYGEIAQRSVAIVVGQDDKIVDVGRHSSRLRQALPESILHVVPRQGHMVHHGAPDLVARCIDAVAAGGRVMRAAPQARRSGAVPTMVS